MALLSFEEAEEQECAGEEKIMMPNLIETAIVGVGGIA